MNFNIDIQTLHLQNLTAARSGSIGPLPADWEFRAEQSAVRAAMRLQGGALATVAHSAWTVLYSVPLLHVSSAQRTTLHAWHARQDAVQLRFNFGLGIGSYYAHNVLWADANAPLRQVTQPYQGGQDAWFGVLALRGAVPGDPGLVPINFTLDSPDYGLLDVNRLA